MKHRLLSLAGALALLAVVGKFWAQPVLAQVRAALVKNVDEPGRSPYRMDGGAIIPPGASHTLGTVPTGKRFVVEYVGIRFSTAYDGTVHHTTGAGAAWLAATTGSGATKVSAAFSAPAAATRESVVDHLVKLYYDPGTTLIIDNLSPSGGPVLQAFLVGYLVDLTQ